MDILQAESMTIRSPRGKNVHFRVGQVIRHKLGNYNGVIIGWDAEAKAPQSWLYKHYPREDVSFYSSHPHYLILVDERDRIKTRMYERQPFLVAMKNTKIVHKSIDAYFDGFDGAQYIPKESLRNLYPDD
uniref:Hemimethylated DNA-binding domain-containing protein n=1 Tax=Strigamia maritima TaxID=126957 RepID=T1JPD8_STRMM